MRLINVSTLEIEEFRGSSIPEYAALSHTWEGSEASFIEWTRRLTRMRKSRSLGFSKIYATCKQARRDGLAYAWIDTICIDKTSSAELTEAINSMYAWYENATVCYVYLFDVPDGSQPELDQQQVLRQSRWFTRGWTLQELLAPSKVVFYSRNWTLLGTKKALAHLISDVTGIDQLCLHKEKRLDQYSIAQRMSWAAQRSTTREEDVAYCLLGLFNINMPLLYGEGKKAFRRLQEEIIKVSDDHSILAFDTNLSDETIFAHHPVVFTQGRQISHNFVPRITPPFFMTNAGLSMTTPMIQTLSPYWCLALLNCIQLDDTNGMRRSQIYLPLFGKDNRYMRARYPVSLISKSVDESAVKLREEIQDLTTKTETTYLISYFGRIYSAYGTDMDDALKGFGIETTANLGFMLTFPRGIGNYRLTHAWPEEDLHRDISFFIPTVPGSPPYDEPSPQPDGILVFEDSTVQPMRRVILYLAITYNDVEATNWTCKLVLDETVMNFDDLEKSAMALRDRLGDDGWGNHYDRHDDAVVAARTRFSTITSMPCIHAVMVELVFDAKKLLDERGV
jgi:hypothetical protein